MNCPKCGQPLNPGGVFCGNCGTATSEAKPESAGQGDRLNGLAVQAWRVLLAAFLNPVENLFPNYERLTKQEVLGVGFAFAVLFDLCAVFGIYRMLPHWAGGPGIAVILKILLFGFVPTAALAGAGFLARKVFRATGGTIESDVFIAGISLVPTAILLLLSGVLGISNPEVTGLVSVVATSYTILTLFTACTRISGIAIVRAVPAVPIILLVTAWLSKVVFAAML
jgi:hypothetical protein